MIISRKDTELAFLGLAPLDVVLEVVECGGRVWDVVICVVGADVECCRELCIALQTQTLVIARQYLALKNRVGLCGITLYFLLDVLTLAGDDNLCWTWLILFTWIGSMARI